MSKYKQVFVDMESQAYDLGWDDFKKGVDGSELLTESNRRDYLQAQADAAYFFADKQGSV